MRIAHITATFPPYESGTGRVAYFNALELARRGHEVSIITAANPPGEFSYPEEFTVQRLTASFGIGNAPVIPTLLALPPVDIIHLHYPFITGAEFVWFSAKRTGTPYVITHHNDLIGNGMRGQVFNAYWATTHRTVIGDARKFITVSYDHAENCKLTPLFRQRWEDVVEIPNGVDTHLFTKGHDVQMLRSQFNIPKSALVIGFVGGLDRAHYFKHVERLIAAVARLKSRDAYLMIVGDGDLKPELVAQSNTLGIGERAVFTGKVTHDALGPYYAALDILVLPSSPPESFGMVLVEAAACAKPVIASDIPGVRSVVKDGETGLLVREGDLDDLANKLDLLLSNESLRTSMGEAGYDRVQAKYTWSAIAERLEALYMDVLDRTSHSLKVETTASTP
jgi:glycosyltransferase involved in cell wall biosynthesis